MLQSPVPLNGLALTSAEHIAESARAADNISRLISAMRRQAWLFTAVSLAGAAVGTLYVMMAEPLYTASATIMLDNRQVRAVQGFSTLSDPTIQDASDVVDSQVEVLHSEKLGLAVVKQLNLTEDSTFVNPPKSWIGKMWASFTDMLGAIIGPRHPLNDGDPSLQRQLTALKALRRDLRVSRLGHTFVLQVDYTSTDPSRAAEIANTYTDAYILEQLIPGVEATRRAQSWLEQRTEELRQLSLNADAAMHNFMADNNLLMTKGALISEQQLNEMTTELVNARAATTQAEARYERIKNIIDTHETEAAVTESLANPVIMELRTKYLDASSRLSELARKLGPAHIAVVNLKNSMDELSTLLFQELGRVAESYRSDYEVAAAREKALTKNLEQQQGVAVVANGAQVQLGQLEQKAESYKTLYHTFLQRFQETAQQEGIPLSEAHVISAASRPLVSSYPRTSLVLAISLGLGILAGAGVGMLREYMDRVFRTVEQLREELAVDVLGMLPILSAESLPQPVPDSMAPILRYAIDNPFSAFAETLRSAKVAADLALEDRSPKIIGLVSLLPGEGKSTVAKNFASLLALRGAKTLLIDADTRNPALTHAFKCKRMKASSQTDLSMSPLAELLKVEPDSGLQFLPCIYAKDDPRVAEGFTPAMLHDLLQSNGQSFRYVVIDLPPIGPTINARAMASAIDAFILVVGWGATSRGAIRSALAKEHSIKDKLLGAILNKVDMKKLKTYEHFGSDGYYHQSYENYYKHSA